MIFSKTRPGEVITSPIYLGDMTQVVRMQECEPHEFTFHLPWCKMPDTPDGVETRIERCHKCQAVRHRIKGPEDFMNTNYPDGATD